jgi:hypothetical protein
MNDDATQEATRERGWWRVLVAVALFLFVPMTPLLRILLPVEQTILLLAPALAVCAVAGWWAGGRVVLAVLWTALAGWVLWQITAGGSSFALLVCGYALLVSAVFGLLLVMPGGEKPRRLFGKALSAIGITLVLAAGATAAVPDGVAEVQASIKADVGRRAEASLTEWRQMTATKQWKDFVVDSPNAALVADGVEKQLEAAPEFAMVLFPSLLALETLAALALAWALYHRVGRARIGAPLAALREFRFNDQFVWGLIAGLVILVLPGFVAVQPVGANLLMFFGMIYALRGMGIVLWFLAPGRLMMAALIGFAVLFWSVSSVLALGLGLGDTWLDWRSRAKPKT